MNELERLIAAVNRLEPSDKLDARINVLFDQVEGPAKTARGKSALLSFATAACVGLLGFCLGRQSVIAEANSPVAASRASQADPRRDATSASATVTRIPLHEDQLVSMFMRPTSREGLLGSGTVTIVTSASP